MEVVLDHEALPTWIAWAAARTSEAEGTPDYAAARDLVARWMEWSSVLLLCDRYDRDAELDLGLEEAMRQAMTRPMDFDGWRQVFEALVEGPRSEAMLGLDARRELPADDPVSEAIWSASGDFELPTSAVQLVRAVADPDNFRDDAAPAIIAAARSLLQRARSTSDFQLVRILGVDGVGGDFDVRHRSFVGTCWPAPRVARLDKPPRFARGELLFWDGAERRVRVPSWLLRIEEPGLELRLYDGRDASTRRWRYRSARPGSVVEEVSRIAGEAPVILAEPTWRTPAPASRRSTPQPATLSAPAPDPDPEVPSLGATPSPAPEHGPARVLLTVLSGRSYLRSCELSDDDSVVIGRNHAFAGFVIHHGQISRSNTRVWTTASGDLYVQDLRSTNGTQLNGKPVGSDPERVKVGDVISVGPVPVGVSWWSEDEAARLRRVTAPSEDRGHDPLTGLRTPAWLADGGDARIAAGFVDDEDQAALYLVIDRLGAVHAQHGSEVGDTLFQNCARAVLSRLPAPGAAVRVGYGEILAMVPEGGAEAAARLGAEILEWAREHRWEHVDQVAITGAVVSRRRDWSVDAWIAEGRRLVAEGRHADGRGRIYRGSS